MRRNRIAVSCLGILVSFINHSTAGETKEITCTGRVVNVQGRPIAEAKVSLYETVYDEATYTYNAKLAGEVKTEADGAFSFSTSADSDTFRYGYIVAEKKGLALGWADWNRRKGDKELEIELRQPNALAGMVVDENNKPVPGARVSVYMLLIDEGEDKRYLTRQLASKLFTAKTDAEGKFTFANLPAEATVDFLVTKTGCAKINTWTTSARLTYAVSQSDIKLVLPVEARIEGVVVEKNTGKSVSGVEVMVRNGRGISYFRQKPVVSKEDGAFSIGALTSDRYTLEPVQPREGPADWVAEPVEVMTETGKTKSGLKVEVSKGGLLEVMVADAASKKPLEKAGVNIRDYQNNRWFHGNSDKNGIARIRLIAGEYQISGVYKGQYTSEGRREAITIEDGKTVRIEWPLAEMPKIIGVVRDEAGKPVGDVKIQTLPHGGREFNSDAQGRFEVIWNPRALESEETLYLVARHKQRNLAAAIEIGTDTKTLNIKLEPGVIFTGKVVDPNGKNIAGARVVPMLHVSNWGASMGRSRTKTDAEGKFEIKAIPAEQRYNVYASAEGYGEKSDVEAYPEEVVDNHLDLGVITLAVANLSVSGIVVDVNDKPVVNARVTCSGKEQPYRDGRTDTEGKFTLDKICAGRIQISANVSGKTRLYGYVETDGGATDVKVVVSERPSATRYIPKQPPSLVGKSLPELIDLTIELSPADTDDKMILVCFWDMDQRPSRHCIIQLAKQAEQLKNNGVTVVAVQASKIDENTLNEWVTENSIPFPVGMTEGDVEKARFTWGVKSLPWLILTNSNHVVTAEGFGFDELGERIKEIENAEH